MQLTIISSASPPISKTYVQMTALIGSFAPGQLYLITNATATSNAIVDLGLLVMAVNTTNIAMNGTAGFLNADYQNVGVYSGISGFNHQKGLWKSTDEAGYVNHDVVIWNNLHWEVINAAAVNGTNPTVNTTAYSQLSKILTHGYIEEWDDIEYGFNEDFITRRTDKRGNTATDNSLYHFDGMFEMQWGNNRCNDNLVLDSSVFKCKNSYGDVEGNIITLNGLLDITNNAGYFANNAVHGEFIRIPNNALDIFDKIASYNGSTFETTVNITGATTIDITQGTLVRDSWGIIILTSSNATETIDKITNMVFQSSFPVKFKPASGLSVTFQGHAISGISADELALPSSTLIVNGSKNQWAEFKTHQDRTIGTFVELVNSQLYL